MPLTALLLVPVWLATVVPATCPRWQGTGKPLDMSGGGFLGTVISCLIASPEVLTDGP